MFCELDLKNRRHNRKNILSARYQMLISAIWKIAQLFHNACNHMSKFSETLGSIFTRFTDAIDWTSADCDAITCASRVTLWIQLRISFGSVLNKDCKNKQTTHEKKILRGERYLATLERGGRCWVARWAILNYFRPLNFIDLNNFQYKYQARSFAGWFGRKFDFIFKSNAPVKFLSRIKST